MIELALSIVIPVMESTLNWPFTSGHNRMVAHIFRHISSGEKKGSANTTLIFVEMHSNCYEVLNSPVYPSQWFVCIPSCQRFTRCVSQDITSLIFLNLKSHFKWKWKCELDLNLWTLIFCLRFIYINMNVTYSKSALILICLSYRKTHYVNVYRYTKIAQNMTTSKLMNECI